MTKTESNKWLSHFNRQYAGYVSANTRPLLLHTPQMRREAWRRAKYKEPEMLPLEEWMLHSFPAPSSIGLEDRMIAYLDIKHQYTPSTKKIRQYLNLPTVSRGAK